MTAPVPSWWQSTTATGGTLTPTCNVGDLLIIVQEGSASNGNAPGTPSSGSGGSWAGGARTSGTDALSNSNPDGRCQVWSKIAASGDSGAAVSINTTGITAAHRWQLIVVPGSWNAGRVAQIVDDSTTNNSIANYGIANTGSTAALLTDTTRPTIVIVTFGHTTAQTSLTGTWDGAVAGSKFQREPFTNEGSATDTTIDHTHHYGSATGICQTDFQEYDSGDTLSSFLWNQSMGNTTHSMAVVVYQTANIVTIGVVAEADTAQALGKTKTLAIGTAAETDTAQAITKTQGFHFAQTANEFDTAQPIVASKKKAIGTASEVDEAQGGFHAHRIVVNTVTETDTAQALLPLKSWADQVTIDDPTVNQVVTSIALTASKNYPVDSGDIRIALYQHGSPVATSGWVALTDTPTVQTLAISNASGTGFAIWWEVRTYGSLDPIISDLGAFTVNIVGTALETDTAQPVGRFPYYPARTVTETDTALPIGRLKSHAIGTATETDTARALGVATTIHSTPVTGTLRNRTTATLENPTTGTLRNRTTGTLKP